MCTLTLVPLGNESARLAFNRDESRSRPAARVPQRRRYGGRTAILPVDPVSSGVIRYYRGRRVNPLSD